MLKQIPFGWKFILLVSALCVGFKGWAQPCTGGTPSYTINLTGRPDSTWLSDTAQRAGTCCSDNNCVEFYVTLDSLSSGIKFDIALGAKPSGALYYQVNCGPLTSVGTELCLSSGTQHHITFCKPGGNANSYKIQAIPKPDIKGKLLITQACIGFLHVEGLVDTSIVWESVPNNPTYNSYLSCTADCDSVSITPTGSYPPSVTYRVAGRIQGGCAGTMFYDTATVYFVKDIDVDIQPKNATVCFGGTNTTITANPIGGLAPFHYQWNTGATTPTISVGAGTYYVSMTDSLGCAKVYDTVTVTSFTMPIDANAGNDSVVCVKTNGVQLNGVIQAAGGGRWSGGAGVFLPNDSTLNAKYYPTAGEIAAGVINLKLKTIQTGTCPPDSDYVQIQIKPSPAPVISGPAGVCAYKSSSYTTNTTVGNMYQWSVTGGTIQGLTTDTTITIKWNASGPGSVTLKQVNTFSCDSTVNKAITIRPTPAPVITGPANVCAYKSSVYTTNTTVGNTYQWSVSGGTIQGLASDTTITVKWNASGFGTITLKQTNTFGCDSTVNRNITILPTPAPVIMGPATVCAYKPSSYSTNITAGNTYLWNVSGGTIQGLATDSAITVKWNASGGGTVTLTQTNVFSCDSTVSKTITIQPTPAPVITGPANVCEYKSSTYTTNTTVGNTYQWSVAGGTIQGLATDTTITVKWNGNGAGSVTLKQTNTFGCDSIVNKTITIQPTPAPVITGPANVCAYKPSTYTTNTTIGNTYQWSVTGGTIQGLATDTTITVRWNASGSGSITLKQTNTFGCDSTVNKSITIQPTPVPVITGPSAVCAYKTTTYTTNTAIGNTYQWNVGGGTIQGLATDTTITVKWNGSGAGNVTLTQTNTFSCDSTVNKSITVQPTPAPVITGPANVCAYKTTTYTANTTVGNTYQWSVTGGIIQGLATDTIITVKWNASGIGNISLTQINVFSCDSTVNKSISIQPTPAPVIIGPSIVCAYKSSTYSTNTTVGNTYQWNVTGGIIQGSTTDTIITVKWNGNGSGSITLTQTNTFSCDSTVNKSITIQPTPAPVITGPATVCAYKSSTYSTNTTTGNTYLWNVTGGIILSGTTDTVITVKWNGNGVGSITLTQINTFSCDSTVNKSIIIQPTPAPVIMGPANVCAYKASTYTTNTTIGNTYQWSVTGGMIQGLATDTTITVKWNASGAGSITLTQTNSFSCDSVVSKFITIQPTPAPIITGPAAVCAYKLSTYSTNTTTGNTYQWNVTGGVIQGSSIDTVITVKWNASGTGSITLTQTNTFSCDSTVNKFITIQPTPAPIITGPAAVCAYKLSTYSTNTTTGNTYQWSVTGGTIQGLATDTTITVKWNVSGTGSVTLMQTNTFSCDSTISKSIIIRPTPAPVIVGPSAVCAYKLSAYSTNTTTGNTYQWSVTGGTIQGLPTDTTIIVKWNASGTGSITLTQTNTFSCDSTISKSITIRPTPAPVIVGPSAVCAYKSSTYSTNTTTGNTYQWSVTGGVIRGSAIDTVVTIQWNGNGAGSVFVTQTNSFGCDSSATRTIIIRPTPIPVIMGSANVCAYKSSTYSTNTTAGNTYQWSVTGGIVQGGTTDTVITVKWSGSSTGSITLTQVTGFGCDSTVKLSTIIRPSPAPVITGPATVCAYKLATYSTNITSGNTYLWSVTGGTIQGSSTDTIVSVKWSGSGTGSVRVTQKNVFGCDSTVSNNVTIQPTPAPVISGPAVICAYHTATYTSNVVTGNTYHWNVTGGTIQGSATDTMITVKWNGGGSGLVSLTQVNGLGCDSTGIRNITIKHVPIPIISGPAVVCAHTTVRYSAPFESGSAFQWSVTGGVLKLLHDSLVEVKWNMAGPGTITLRIVSMSLCDSIVTNSIMIQPTPNPDFSGPLTPCAWSMGTYAVAPQAGHTYNWTVSGGTVQGSTTSNTIDVLWGTGGLGTVRLEERSPSGCDSIIVKGINIKARPAAKILGEGIACAGPSIYTYKALPVGDYTYNWTVQGGTIVAGTGTSAIDVNWPHTGTYTITLNITDNITSCDSIATIAILVDTVIRPEINASALVGCVPLRISFTGNQSLPGYTYLWSFGNGNYSTNVNPEFVYGQPGEFAIKVVVKGPTGCKDSASTGAKVNFIPVADFDYEYQHEKIYAGEDTVIFINKSRGGNLFLWKIRSDSLDTIVSPHNVYKSPGFYTVKLSTIDTTSGCERSITKRLEVRVRERLYIPNAFTPNNDGINDYFSVSVTNIVEFEVLIFNRWGTVIYRSNDPYFKWDGTFENEPVQSDVYGYIINAKGYHGKTFTQSGNVTVLR